MFLSLIMLINYTQSVFGVSSVDWILAVTVILSDYLHSDNLHWKQAKKKPLLFMPPHPVDRENLPKQAFFVFFFKMLKSIQFECDHINSPPKKEVSIIGIRINCLEFLFNQQMPGCEFIDVLHSSTVRVSHKPLGCFSIVRATT